MTDYPEDIMKVASEAALDIWKALGEDIPMGRIETINPIARAILAERKRCAYVARLVKDDPASGSADWDSACIKIEESIMKGGAA